MLSIKRDQTKKHGMEIAYCKCVVVDNTGQRIQVEF